MISAMSGRNVFSVLDMNIMGYNFRTAITLAVLTMTIAAVPTWPAAAQAASPPDSIFGTYGKLSAGRDSIRVIRQPGGKIGLVIKLYYSNGHTCDLTADGDWRDEHIAVVADGLDPSRTCTLNAFFRNNRISLKDDGLRCAPVYCGARGKLDNVSLPRTSRK
jgi:hypothetical protein